MNDDERTFQPVRTFRTGGSKGSGGGKAVRWPVRLWRDRSAASAVEFALVGGPFLLMLMMVFQVGLFHFAQNSLDDATRSAARLVMTGKVAASNQGASGFRDNLLCPKLLFMLECSSVTVRAYKVSLTSDASQGTGIYQFVDKSAKALRSPSSNAFCLGMGNDYVFLDVTYVFSKSISSLFKLLSGNGAATMRSTSLFRNEPFATGGSSC